MLINYNWRAHLAGPMAIAVSSKEKMNNMFNIPYSEFQSIFYPTLSSLAN